MMDDKIWIETFAKEMARSAGRGERREDRLERAVSDADAAFLGSEVHAEALKRAVKDGWRPNHGTPGWYYKRGETSQIQEPELCVLYADTVGGKLRAVEATEDLSLEGAIGLVGPLREEGM